MTIARSGFLALSLAASFIVPALAQPASGTKAANAPVATPAAVPARSGPTGTLQKTHDDWRSSQLVGATVYTDGGASIGTIDNLLIGDDGKVGQVVLSVGGFLGIGSKLVAVPFDQLKFEHSRGMAVAAAPVTGAAGASDANGATPGAVGTVPPAGSLSAPSPTAAGTPANRSAMGAPDYFSVVMPGATKDTLNSMPSFQYNK